MPEYELIDFVEQAWTLRCTRCKVEAVLVGPMHEQRAAERFTAAGWEVRGNPRLLCPTCVDRASQGRL